MTASSSPGFLRPMRLLPLVPISLATIAALVLAVRSNFTNLASLWTQCSGHAPRLPLDLPLGPHGSSAALLPTPLCFAVSFFQAALSSTRSRLEEASIVAFLAGLATVTAVERARLQNRNASARASGGPAEREPRDEKTTTRRGPPGDVEGERRGGGGVFSARVIRNLTLPWLLYNLALGALSWQGLIIPAFIRQGRPEPPTRKGGAPGSPAASPERLGEEDIDPASTVAIPLSVALGLLLPSTLMIARPSSPAIVLAWLVFPLWVSLTHRLARYALTKATTPGQAHPIRLSAGLLYAVPIIYSAVSHFLLVANLVWADDDRSPLTRSAVLLLEIDHAAIFAAVLYWVFVSAGSGLRGVSTTLIASLLLGPGAGVCAAWLYGYHGGVGGGSGGGGGGGCGSSSGGTVAYGAGRVGRRPRGRRRTTGHFFGGPDY